jgi:hypothetical protein
MTPAPGRHSRRLERDRHLTASLWFSAMLAVHGCAVQPPATSTATEDPPAEDWRASLGSIGIVSVLPSPEGRLEGPVGVGNESAKGAGTTALYAAGGLVRMGGVGGLLLAPIGLIVGGVIGGVTGAVRAVPENAAREIQASVQRVVDERDWQAELRQRVVSRAQGETEFEIVDLHTRATPQGTGSPEHAAGAADGVQSLLEVGIHSVRLSVSRGSDLRLTIAIDARARVIRIADHTVLWTDDGLLASTSPNRSFSEWNADGGALIGNEFAGAMEYLARVICHELFGKPLENPWQWPVEPLHVWPPKGYPPPG